MKNNKWTRRAASVSCALAVWGGCAVTGVAESLDLEWDRSTSSNVAQYRVYRATSATGAYGLLLTTTATKATVTTAGSAAGHRFYVTSVTAQGLESDPSNSIGVTPTPEYRLVGGRLSVQWSDPGYTLQSAPSVHGPWAFSSSASPMLVTLAGPSKFFRLWKQ